MTNAINPDELITRLTDVLALLGQLWQQRGFGGMLADDLLAAADRLFAQPDRDPREQAVLDAARAWYDERRKTLVAPNSTFGLLKVACEALWPATPAACERCAVPRCEAAGTERHTRPFDPALLLCPEHAEWLGGFVP